ncbi:hypothetical protein DSM112329_04617 [Paraconexibacter sp. AEG42_29]|uniref:Uncharacterized protein n=1 Tax=Paraconexibacter sp. AEG42_29 TaxID=2997339 RepID=A0AAU7B223_9ACTN
MNLVLRHRAVGPALIATLALLVAGCGGKSSSTTASATAGAASTAIGAPIDSVVRAPGKVTLRAGLLGDAASAGSGRSYLPTGAIVGDSGFRPDVDGFAFENYGNDAGPVNLRPANVEDIFGNQVCAIGTGPTCRLIPAAAQWMEQQNEAMADGHCMGFSVTALRFFAKTLKPAVYGANRTIDLPVRGNTDLQSLIAEDFAYQSLPAVTDRAVEGTPTQVLNKLVAALRTDKEAYTLGIYKADGTGGHAITPFAVEDKGRGLAKVLVYDNNFPGVIRGVDVDTNTNRWRYVGGINPANADEVYEGDARTRSLFLLPTKPGEGLQPCPFCPKVPGRDLEYPVPDRLKYIEVVLRGRDANHPRLLFKDEQGRETGFKDGRFVREIPGVKVIQDLSVQNWEGGAEPRYHLPLGHPQYEVTVDGADLKREVTTRISVNGGGVVFYVDGIKMNRGQQDKLILPADDLGILYISGRNFPGSPTLAAEFPQFDLLGHKRGTAPKARLITMATGWIGFKPGSPIGLKLKPANGTVEVASPGGQRLSAKDARFVVTVESEPIGKRSNFKARNYFGELYGVNPDTGESLRFHYLRNTTKTLPVDILDNDNKKVRTEQLPQRK